MKSMEGGGPAPSEPYEKMHISFLKNLGLVEE